MIEELSPRYIYGSNSEMYHKRIPFLNKDGFLSRFIALANIPGKHKLTDSKNVYIQAIEIEAISSISENDLKIVDCEHTVAPYTDVYKTTNTLDEKIATAS